MSWASARAPSVGGRPAASIAPATSTSAAAPSPRGSPVTTHSTSAGGGGWTQPRVQGSASSSSFSTSAQAPASPVSPRSGTPKAGGWAQAHVSRAPQTQAQVSQEELNNVDATTARMLQRLELTEEIADATLSELDDQNRKIRGMQDDLAEVHDDLDTSSRKLAGIKSFWGVAWGKKKHDQRHVKERAEYEKEFAKQAMKEERARQQSAKKSDAAAQESHMAHLARALDDPVLHKELRSQEKADRAAARAQQQQQQQSRDEPLRFEADGFFFEEREDALGEPSQAERDLEQIHEHVQSLKSKAWTMGQRVDESSRRLDNVQAEVDRADARTNKNIQRGNKIIG